MRGKSVDRPAKVRFVPVGVKTLPNLRKAVYRFRDEVTDQALLTKVREAYREHKAAYGGSGVYPEQPLRLPSGDDVDDFPLQGPRTVYRDVRQLRSSGMDFTQHHEIVDQEEERGQGYRSFSPRTLVDLPGPSPHGQLRPAKPAIVRIRGKVKQAACTYRDGSPRKTGGPLVRRGR
eukprot:s2454_g2.t1